VPSLKPRISNIVGHAIATSGLLVAVTLVVVTTDENIRYWLRMSLLLVRQSLRAEYYAIRYATSSISFRHAGFERRQSRHIPFSLLAYYAVHQTQNTAVISLKDNRSRQIVARDSAGHVILPGIPSPLNSLRQNKNITLTSAPKDGLLCLAVVTRCSYWLADVIGYAWLVGW